MTPRSELAKKTGEVPTEYRLNVGSVPLAGEKRPNWLRTAEAYCSRGYNTAYVKEFANPTQLIAFYILLKAGVLEEPVAATVGKERVRISKANTTFTSF